MINIRLNKYFYIVIFHFSNKIQNFFLNIKVTSKDFNLHVYSFSIIFQY